MQLKGLKQAQLAKRLGLSVSSQSRVSRLISNVYVASPCIILQLNDILGLDIFELMKKYWKEEKA